MSPEDERALCAVENKLLALELRIEKLKGYLDEVVDSLIAEFGRVRGR